MLMAHPTTLRTLVEKYETLRRLYAEQGGPETLRRLDDVAYTLCVSTGTRTVPAALAAAAEQLAGAGCASAAPSVAPPSPTGPRARILTPPPTARTAATAAPAPAN